MTPPAEDLVTEAQTWLTERGAYNSEYTEGLVRRLADRLRASAPSPEEGKALERLAKLYPTEHNTAAGICDHVRTVAQQALAGIPNPDEGSSLQKMQIARSAQPSADAAVDWVMVPREPTEEMLVDAAFANVPWEYESSKTEKTMEGPFALELSGPNKETRAKEVAAALYRAMIAAAPSLEEISQNASCANILVPKSGSEEITPAHAAGGWVTVPREPSREMWAAMGNAVVGYKQRHHDKVCEQVWTAALAAAPSPTWSEEQVERAARALQQSFSDTRPAGGFDPGPFTWDDFDEAGQERYRAAVRAALSALQEG